MGGEFMSKKNRLPEIIIFAGPNGSGKTTITRMARTIGVYINADDIKRSSLCSDLEAAVKAEELREEMIEKVKISHLKQCSLLIGILNCLKKLKKRDIF